MFATHVILLNNDLLEEDPAVIESELLQRHYDAFDYNRFMAAKLIMETNWYWANLQNFMVLSDAITYGHTISSSIPRPSMESMGWSIIEATLLTPELSECQPNPNIIAYIEARAKYENEMPISLKRFIKDKELKNIDSPYLNNWIIVQLGTLIKGLDTVLEYKKDNLTMESLADLKKRLHYLFEEEVGSDLLFTTPSEDSLSRA